MASYFIVTQFTFTPNTGISTRESLFQAYTKPPICYSEFFVWPFFSSAFYMTHHHHHIFFVIELFKFANVCDTYVNIFLYIRWTQSFDIFFYKDMERRKDTERYFIRLSIFSFFMMMELHNLQLIDGVLWLFEFCMESLFNLLSRAYRCSA